MRQGPEPAGASNRDQPFKIRPATAADAAVIARHRARMFQDMGQLPPSAFDSLRTAAELALAGALARREYLGWLLTPEGEPARVVAGAGVQLRNALPHPVDIGEEVSVAAGRHGVVLNVFTEPAWRRHGLADLLMRHVLEWARAQRLDPWCSTRPRRPEPSTSGSDSWPRTRCSSAARCSDRNDQLGEAREDPRRRRG